MTVGVHEQKAERVKTKEKSEQDPRGRERCEEEWKGANGEAENDRSRLAMEESQVAMNTRGWRRRGLSACAVCSDGREHPLLSLHQLAIPSQH